MGAQKLCTVWCLTGQIQKNAASDNIFVFTRDLLKRQTLFAVQAAIQRDVVFSSQENCSCFVGKVRYNLNLAIACWDVQWRQAVTGTTWRNTYWT